jgi:nitroreductase
MKKYTLLLLMALALPLCACNGQKKDQKNEQTVETTVKKDFMDIAAERYSVRHFSTKAVEQEKIDLILEAGKLAPTAVNSQPQMIYVLRSEDAVAKANQFSPCMYGAPHAFLFCYDDNRVCRRGENGNFGEIDVTIVLTHMMLEAYNLGLGTCPVGAFNIDEAKRLLELPDNIHPILMMPVGYPAADAKPSDRHTVYRNMDEMIEYK